MGIPLSGYVCPFPIVAFASGLGCLFARLAIEAPPLALEPPEVGKLPFNPSLYFPALTALSFERSSL